MDEAPWVSAALHGGGQGQKWQQSLLGQLSRGPQPRALRQRGLREVGQDDGGDGGLQGAGKCGLKGLGGPADPPPAPPQAGGDPGALARSDSGALWNHGRLSWGFSVPSVPHPRPIL